MAYVRVTLTMILSSKMMMSRNVQLMQIRKHMQKGSVQAKKTHAEGQCPGKERINLIKLW